jgi:CTP synthase
VPEKARKKLQTKYIFISGGVISGIGKGITSASISFLLKSSGYTVAPLKFENYLNLDAGTINPIEHGDPFLCEDGTEADMDIGTYEKFLDEDMGKDNFVTIGKIYQTVLDRERAFEYNGEDVEAIPHVTDEIIKRIEELGKKKKADMVIIELGGTAGEYQNILYYEAARIMTLRNPGDVLHVHVSYLPTPNHLGEPKTKPTQLSVRTLNSMGIQPDFIVARSDKFVDERRRARFALFCNMKAEDIISNPDVKSVFEIPKILAEQKLSEKILAKFGLPIRKPNLSQIDLLLKKIYKSGKKNITIAIIGKYFATGEYKLRDSYAALFDALDHAAWETGVQIKEVWVSAEEVEKKGADIIGKPDGIIVPIGWGSRGAEGMIAAASYARRKKIPYLGLCYGMQLACIAFARDIIGWSDANTSENDTNTPHQVIHLMPAQAEFMKNRAYGGTMRLGAWEAIVKKGTIAYEAYKRHGGLLDKNGLTSERHRHRYEFNDEFVDAYERKGFVISARSVKENLAEIIELSASIHPFYVGTQGHPEYKSRPNKPHPLFIEFLNAAKKSS